MNEFETKQFYFMTIAEWFCVDEDFNIQLTELGKQNGEAVKSFKEYQAALM